MPTSELMPDQQKPIKMSKHLLSDDAKVRLDKWLWAARFFKTRSLAKTAVEGGKVQYNGVRSKPSRFVELGATLKIRQGFTEKTVIVTGLAEQRGKGQDAACLYEETPESISLREAEAQHRRLFRESDPLYGQRPNKKERRQIVRFQRRESKQDDA